MPAAFPVITLDSCWKLVERRMVHEHTTPAQRLQIQMAFYAGAQSILELQHVLDDVQPDAAATIRRTINNEADNFARLADVRAALPN